MTALEIVRQVQRELRLPQSESVNEPHARLILDFANKVQRSLMLENVVWDELKEYGYFDTEAGKAIYTVSVVNNGEIDVIRSLQIGNDYPLIKKPDEEFRELKRLFTGNGKPLYYRHLSRIGGSIVVELLPVPDASYSVNAEVLVKPPRLVNDTDIPLLDPDTIILGTIMLARKEQGEDYSLELSAFQSKLSMQSDTQGESNWGDVEAV